jgi:hypothetical protein
MALELTQVVMGRVWSIILAAEGVEVWRRPFDGNRKREIESKQCVGVVW